MEKLLVTVASGKEVTPPPSITPLLSEDFDFDNLRALLSVFLDTFKTTKIQAKPEKKSARLMNEAMNVVPVAKGLQSDVHTLLELFIMSPVTTASAERFFSSLCCIKTYLYIHQDVLDKWA